MSLLIMIISMLLATCKLYQFFIDYKRDKFFLASIELIFAVMLATAGACAVWNSTLQIIT